MLEIFAFSQLSPAPLKVISFCCDCIFNNFYICYYNHFRCIESFFHCVAWLESLRVHYRFKFSKSILNPINLGIILRISLIIAWVGSLTTVENMFPPNWANIGLTKFSLRLVFCIHCMYEY